MGKDEEAKEINYTNKSKYLLYLADRCELIVEQMKLDKNENWYKEFSEIYKELKNFDSQSEAEKEYPKILKEVIEKHPDVFKNIEDIFKNKTNKDFIKFIVKKHPFNDIEKEGFRNYEEESPEFSYKIINIYNYIYGILFNLIKIIKIYK